MSTEILNVSDNAGCAIQRSGSAEDSLDIRGYYDVQCFDAQGNLRWEDTIKNLVVTVGKNDLLDKYFAGSAYTAAWYMGLVSGASTPTYDAADTLASHSGWTESTAYSGGNRITVAWNAAAAGSKSSTATTFNINASATIAGALLTVTQSNSVNTGVLYSAGNFTGGNRTVSSGDSLLVTYTASV